MSQKYNIFIIFEIDIIYVTSMLIIQQRRNFMLEVSRVELEGVNSNDQIKNVQSSMVNPDDIANHDEKFKYRGNSYEKTNRFFNKLLFGNLEE
nr:MAG TPA: hypothetical protein [Caudoviricetes sp.]